MSKVNLTMQFNEVDDEMIGDDIKELEELDMVRLHVQGDLQVYEYPRQVLTQHLQAHSKMHILYKKITRQLPNGIWILCDDPSILMGYKAFALREINDVWKTSAMHCYTEEQYENFMEPGLCLELPPDTSAQFLEEVKQCIQATIKEMNKEMK